MIVTIAIITFILHLLLIVLVNLHVLQLNDYSKLLSNPIAAIYTPFSFILVYEVFLLVYYLPKSTSTYIGKQYEIIALIIIRRVFKDFIESAIYDGLVQGKKRYSIFLRLTGDDYTVRADFRFLPAQSKKGRTANRKKLRSRRQSLGLSR